MVSQTVAEFVASADPESLPPEVSHAVKRSLLNFFATALEGTHDIAVETALKTMLPFAGMSEATLIGRAERTDAMTATFINAAAIVLNAALDVTFFGDSISVLEATCFAVILSAIFLYSNLAKDYKPAAALPSAT